MAYKDLNDEQLEDLALLDLPDEQLAEIHFELVFRHAKLVLGMNERCYQRFGKKFCQTHRKQFSGKWRTVFCQLLTSWKRWTIFRFSNQCSLRKNKKPELMAQASIMFGIPKGKFLYE